MLDLRPILMHLVQHNASLAPLMLNAIEMDPSWRSSIVQTRYCLIHDAGALRSGPMSMSQYANEL